MKQKKWHLNFRLAGGGWSVHCTVIIIIIVIIIVIIISERQMICAAIEALPLVRTTRLLP